MVTVNNQPASDLETHSESGHEIESKMMKSKNTKLLNEVIKPEEPYDVTFIQHLLTAFIMLVYLGIAFHSVLDHIYIL